MDDGDKAILGAVKEMDSKVDRLIIDVAVLKSQNTGDRLRTVELKQASQGKGILASVGAGGGLGAAITWLMDLLKQ